MRTLSEAAVDRAVRKVSRLRALFRRLSHQPTPAESRLLAEFESFRTGRLSDVSAAAVRAGFRAAWSARDYGTIASVATRLDPGLVEADRMIRTLLEHATLLAGREAGAQRIPPQSPRPSTSEHPLVVRLRRLHGPGR